MREGVAKESADPNHDVDPGTAQFFERDQLEAQDATILPVPGRPHAEQGENLGDVIPLGPDRAWSPRR